MVLSSGGAKVSCGDGAILWLCYFLVMVMVMVLSRGGGGEVSRSDDDISWLPMPFNLNLSDIFSFFSLGIYFVV